MIKCENMKKEQQKNIRDKHVNDENLRFIDDYKTWFCNW